MEEHKEKRRRKKGHKNGSVQLIAYRVSPDSPHASIRRYQTQSEGGNTDQGQAIEVMKEPPSEGNLNASDH